MDGLTAEMIGDEIGEFIEVEVGDDGLAVGEYLRIKICMDIRKPIMRGITLQFGDNMLPRWCPFEYEFLPDFCHTCGIIGHGHRSCSIKRGKGENQQFGNWLKAAMPRKNPEAASYRLGDGRGGSSRGARSSFDWSKDGKQSRSDSESWKKAELNNRRNKDSDGGGKIGKS
jgi:hypothetical protein